MKQLKDRILQDGKVLPGNVLKVDGFLNHQIDVNLIKECAEEWYRRYEGEKITKIVTVEASGIGIACIAGLVFNVPVVFAKKTKSSNIGDDLYSSKVVSYTHGTSYNVIMSRNFISPEDRILIVDDFLANGSALRALIKLCEAGGAAVVGAGIVIEKAYQTGASDIRSKGYRVESLARIAAMDVQDGVTFID